MRIICFINIIQTFWLAGSPSTGLASACSWSGVWLLLRATAPSSSTPSKEYCFIGHGWNADCVARVLLPLFQKHSSKIDAAIDKAGAKAGDLFDKAMEKAKDYAAEQQLNKND